VHEVLEDPQDPSGLFRRASDPVELLQGSRRWLLQGDVLSGVQSRSRVVLVQVVRRQDVHGIYFGIGEHPVEIGVAPPRTPFRRAPLRQLPVHVTDGDDSCTWVSQVSEALEICDAPASQHPDSDLFHDEVPLDLGSGS